MRTRGNKSALTCQPKGPSVSGASLACTRPSLQPLGTTYNQGGKTMRVNMFVLAVLAFLVGFVILAGAKGAVHEIEAFVLYLIAAVLFSGAAVVDAIINLPKRLPGRLLQTSDVTGSEL